MERLKKTNQTMLLVVGFLTAIIPAFTFTEKLYNGSNLVFYSTLISALAGVIVFLILGSKFADKYAVRYVLVVVYGLTYAFWILFSEHIIIFACSYRSPRRVPWPLPDRATSHRLRTSLR